MKKRLTLEGLTKELLASKAEYNSVRNRYTNLKKPTDFDQTYKNRERDRYRRALIQGIKCLSGELLATIDEDMQPAEIVSAVSAIERDIANGTGLDIPDAE